MQIKLFAKNAKQHPEKQLKAIARSIERFGFRQPIVVDKDDTIVVGHGRYLAATQVLGLSELQERASAAKNEKFIPFQRITDLTVDEVKAYRLADNKLNETDWDELLLAESLQELTSELQSDAGFSEWEVTAALNKLLHGEEDDFDSTLPTEPRTKRGDLWILGEHNLLCGDAIKREDVERLMEGEKADMVFTDPPYGMFLDADFSEMVNKLDFAKEKGFKSGRKYDNVVGDHDDFNPEFINTVFNNFDCKEVFLWGVNYYSELLPEKNNGSWIVWDKRLDESADRMYGSCFELCWSKQKHKQDIVRVKWAGVFGTEQEFDHKRHHPTQKPIKLSSWFIGRYSEPNWIIVDLFGGSGSTLIACEQMKRKCLMMEIDEKYCDVIVARWEKLTGKKATKAEHNYAKRLNKGTSG